MGKFAKFQLCMCSLRSNLFFLNVQFPYKDKLWPPEIPMQFSLWKNKIKIKKNLVHSAVHLGFISIVCFIYFFWVVHTEDTRLYPFNWVENILNRLINGDFINWYQDLRIWKWMLIYFHFWMSKICYWKQNKWKWDIVFLHTPSEMKTL